jgi:valyl-tRNA synthetase
MNDASKTAAAAIPEIFLKPYDPAAHEDRLYELWENSGFFNPDVCLKKGIAAADAPTFSIVLPPPNVTGTLHMGHAAMLAVEDILVRRARMQGKRTLWIPGTDSAAIATQSKVESELYKKEGKTRHDLGREEFLKRVYAFAEDSKNTIIGQTKKMGSSLDWSRYAFTLDDTRYRAVMTAFKRMYDAGLIYRGARIVNWDPKMQTTVSDVEIEHVEQTDQFYYLKYGPFVIGTARPETKFGDKYVVMHPDDARYCEYTHGQTLELEWINGPIMATVIKDTSIDMTFGTGVMTITPWHDATDFDIAERHGLDKVQIIDERGILLPIAGEFAGIHIKKARAAIIEKLQKKGLVTKIEQNYVHNVATNSRGGGTIEPQIKEQWFINVNKEFTLPQSNIEGIAPSDSVTLKKLMRQVVDNGSLTMYPEHFQGIYHHWVENLHDWCISRQIWYGHRIPVWYKNGEVYCDVTPPSGDGWVQDPDTLDTWFSSGLWTFSTLGWPEATPDLKTYHPTTVLETGYDILPFWVARMILMSTFLLGEKPFTSVYFHGLVRDEKNRKMSKSLGNIIDPLDMIAKYGADAVRLSLIIGAAPGNDVPLSEQKTKGYKHFANKLWNITRFTLTALDGYDHTSPVIHTDRDQEILAQLHAAVADVSSDIDKFSLHLAAEKIYHYIWHELADKILEEAKPVLNGTDALAKTARQAVLAECLVTSIKLLHPFMPFVTEAIWQELPAHLKDNELLMVAKWPKQS